MNTPSMKRYPLRGLLAALCTLLLTLGAPGVASAQGGAVSTANPTVPANAGMPAMWWNASAMGAVAGDTTFQRDRIFMKGNVPGQTLVYDAVFEDDLFLQTDLVLPGIGSAQSITFPRPLLWNLKGGTELRIRMDHSTALIAERSNLTISINDVMLKSYVLSAKNATDAELVFDVPLEILNDYNTLKFEVAQHYTDECEDPFDPSLWTKISRRSYFHFVYEAAPMQRDLLSFPLPLFDPRGYGPTFVEFVLPSNPTAESLEALGVVAAGLGREVSYRPLAVGSPLSSLSAATGNAIAVGTVNEIGDLRTLLGSRIAGLGGGQGLVALVPNPARPHTTVLVVTGADGPGVLAAARALTSIARHEVLSGTSSVITSLKQVEAAEMRVRQDFVPPETTFTLEDLGIEDVTVRGFFASPIRIPVRSLPDLQFIEGQQVVRIYYSYGAQLHTASSTMEIRWNNISLESVPLDNPEGENRAYVDVNIPVEVMAPYNNLEIVFNLFPRNYGPCDFKTDRHIWGSVFNDTAFSMPRYHFAEMPDLGKLQYGYYPYGLYQDLQETLLVTADTPDSSDLLYTAIMAAELGRKTRADRIALKTKRGNAVTAGDRSDNHMILLYTGNRHSEVEALAESRPLAIMGTDKKLRSTNGLVLEAMDPSTHSTVEELLSPYANDKIIIIVQGFTQEYMEGALRLMSDPVLLSQLSGDISLLGADESLQAVDTGHRASFGSKPVTLKARDWGREHRWLMVFFLIVAIFLLYLLIQWMIGSTSGGDDGGDDDNDGGGGDPDRSFSESESESEPEFEDDFFSPPETSKVEEEVWTEESPRRRAPPRRPAPRRRGDSSEEEL